ncbi:hypothetical protein ACETRX_22760 [Labrys portucalensis]|uniref:Uncharacterized protein n=1 Tax=Labrys neptuniae TaxID=376174 RepID=A0ABV6ZJW3_9HYPH
MHSTENGIYWAAGLIIGLTVAGLSWAMLREAACPISVTLLPPGATQPPCFEFWINRYQGLLGGLLGLAAGILAFVGIQSQMAEARRIAKETNDLAMKLATRTETEALERFINHARFANNYLQKVINPDFDPAASDVERQAEKALSLMRHLGKPDSILAQFINTEDEIYPALAMKDKNEANSFKLTMESIPKIISSIPDTLTLSKDQKIANIVLVKAMESILNECFNALEKRTALANHFVRSTR